MSAYGPPNSKPWAGLATGVWTCDMLALSAAQLLEAAALEVPVWARFRGKVYQAVHAILP